MGNKLCKKKTDSMDTSKSPTPFDRIINRLHLRPNSWKSDSHLNQKQVNRQKSENEPKENNIKVKQLSKSSDWTDVALEVPQDDVIHLQNPKLTLIFDDGKATPEPPPRKHKKGFREKLESVAKNSLQALQSKKSVHEPKPVDEPLFIKKTVNPTCPIDEHDCAIHNRNHKHELRNNIINENKHNDLFNKSVNKDDKRRKNLSVVSLPNYSELKLTVATFDDIDKKETKPPNSDNNSIASLPGEQKKISNTTNPKLDTRMTRCRSFGSLLPHQLLDRWRVRKVPTDIESDDSFGALEDWDLRLLEHYNPKDASLPRPRKHIITPQNNKEILSNIEDMIVKDDDVTPPTAPTRKSESMIKRINRVASEAAGKNVINNNRCKNVTPPPSPSELIIPKVEKRVSDEKIEHSTLMKILEKYSDGDDRLDNEIPYIDGPENESNDVKLQKDIATIEGFLLHEKLNISREFNHQTEKVKV